jgi:hypothetical protein
MKINEKNKITYLTMVKGVSNSQDAFMDAGCINTGMVSSDNMKKLLNKLPQKSNGKKIVVFVVTDYGEYVEVLKNKYGDFCDIYCIPTSCYGYRLCISALSVYVDNPEKFVIFDKSKLQSTGLCDKYLKYIIKNKNMNADIADIIKDGGELYCLQNPPYKKSLHLDFFNVGLDLITKFNGKMVIIEPASWLIDVRKYGKKGENYRVNSSQILKYEQIKSKINGHIESVIIENFNTEFNVENDSPFSITTIDMSKSFDTIDYTCFGVQKKVNTIYDCNLVGDYKTIHSIIDKISCCDTMRNHTTTTQIDGDFWYVKYTKCGRCSCKSGGRYHLDSYYKGNHFKYYYYMGCDDRDESSNMILKKRNDANELTDVDSQCVFGTKDEINNWEHFIFNNKLSLFLSLTLTYDQSNHIINFLPWLVDKQYTDDEINKLFGFTDEEIKLIDSTIKKYERNSPWFKRYMCGKSVATDEEVTEYIKKITEEC